MLLHGTETCALANQLFIAGLSCAARVCGAGAAPATHAGWTRCPAERVGSQRGCARPVAALAAIHARSGVCIGNSEAIWSVSKKINVYWHQVLGRDTFMRQSLGMAALQLTWLRERAAPAASLAVSTAPSGPMYVEKARSKVFTAVSCAAIRQPLMMCEFCLHGCLITWFPVSKWLLLRRFCSHLCKNRSCRRFVSVFDPVPFVCDQFFDVIRALAARNDGIGRTTNYCVTVT